VPATKLKVADIELELFETGQGRPLLFLHAAAGFDQGQPFVAPLSQKYRLIAPSHPGFGQSSLPEWLDSVDDIAYVYLELLDSLKLKEIDLIGCSIGGWIAAELATKAPERVRRLVMVGPVGVKVGPADKLDIPDIFAMPQAEVQKLLHHDPVKMTPDPSKMTDEQMATMFRNRETIALLVWEPWMHRMIQAADARIVETEGNLGIYTNVDCYSVRRDWLRANRDTALRFLRALVNANDAISKDHRIAYHAWAREVGLSNASAEEVFNVVPPPLIYEWTNPRYTYSLVKGGPLYQRLGFLASYMARYGIIRQTVELDDAMDMSLIAEVLKGRKPP